MLFVATFHAVCLMAVLVIAIGAPIGGSWDR
jgi:hypothetical protein